MRTLFALLALATLVASENAVVLPSQSDFGLFRVGFNGDVLYRQRNGPDFVVYYITPMGLTAGCEITVYDGEHPHRSNDVKTIKKIQMDGQGVWELEIKESENRKGYYAVGYYPFGHLERYNEKGELAYSDKDRTLQVTVSASSLPNLEASLKMLSFSIVK
jgi:hypothetical protein